MPRTVEQIDAELSRHATALNIHMNDLDRAAVKTRIEELLEERFAADPGSVAP